MIRRLLLTTGVLAGLVLALAAPSFGGPGGPGGSGGTGGTGPGDQAGDGVLLVDGDGAVPMFHLPDLALGTPHARCIRVTNAGTRAVDARVFGHVDGRLRNALEVEITRGALGPGAAFPACGGFVPDGTIHGGLGPGVIFRGSLAALSGRFADATVDPGTWEPGATRAYRFVVTLTSLPDRRHLQTSASFVWKARGA